MANRAALKECVVFQSLSEAELDRITDMCSLQDYAAGATVFSEGAPSDTLYVLQSGKVALQMRLLAGEAKPGARISVDIVSKGEVIGWSALVTPRWYKLTAVCLEPTRLLAIDGLRLTALMQEDTNIGYEVLNGLIGVVASRLDETRRVLISERQIVAQD